MSIQVRRKFSLKLLPLPLALSFMLLGLLLGLFRLMINNEILIRIIPFEHMYVLHGQIIIFGFLTILIMFERIVGLEVLPSGRKSITAKMMLPFFTAGFLSFLFGNLVGLRAVTLFGSALLVIGSILFAHTIRRLMSYSTESLSFGFMLLGTVALTSSSILSSSLLPVDRTSFALLLLSFPVLFILGERVELTKFSSAPSERRRLKAAFAVALVSLALLVLYAMLVRVLILIITSLVGYLLAFLVVYLAENSSLRRLSASPSPLHRYVGLHTKFAYLWILIGTVLFILLLSEVGTPHFYDAAVHSIGVGFVGTMILAHGPIIMPALLGRSLKVENLSLIPLSLLTAANVVRVFGNVVKPFYPSFSYAVGYSGLLVLMAIMAFFLALRRTVAP